MKNLTITLLLTLSLSPMAFSQEEKSMDDTYEEAYEEMSAGMNENEKAKVREMIDKQKEQYRALSALSPEDQKKQLDEAEEMTAKLLKNKQKSDK